METNEIEIPLGKGMCLQGNLTIPSGSTMLVVFSHGSGSSHLSNRNKHVAMLLNKEKITTLLIDLLTESEDAVYENHFDTDLLTKRLVHITTYLIEQSDFQNFKLGYFGSGTGTGAALKASIQMGEMIHAIVSRGGQPNISKEDLVDVKVPTLLIIGDVSDNITELNQWAYTTLQCKKKLEIVHDTSHHFEEANKLDEVARLAANWFTKYMHQELLTS